MRNIVIALLLCFWLFFAWRAFQAGDMAMAGLYLLIGIALTAYRIYRRV